MRCCRSRCPSCCDWQYPAHCSSRVDCRPTIGYLRHSNPDGSRQEGKVDCRRATGGPSPICAKTFAKEPLRSSTWAGYVRKRGTLGESSQDGVRRRFATNWAIVFTDSSRHLRECVRLLRRNANSTLQITRCRSPWNQPRTSSISSSYRPLPLSRSVLPESEPSSGLPPDCELGTATRRSSGMGVGLCPSPH